MKPATFNHVIITRFSVRLSHHHFQKKTDLLSKERLDKRFELFDKVYLRGLSESKIKDFKVILIVDVDLPVERYDELKSLIDKWGLKELISIYEWDDVLDNINTLGWLRIFKPDLFNKDMLVQTRLDDDDTIKPNFITRMHCYIRELLEKNHSRNNIDKSIISFIDGNYLVIKGGKFYVKKRRARCGGAGLTYIEASNRDNCIYKYDHSRLKNPDYGLDIYERMRGTALFVVTAHEFNDSNRFDNLSKKTDDNEMFNTLDEAIKYSLES